jgi:hypothetical protein
MSAGLNGKLLASCKQIGAFSTFILVSFISAVLGAANSTQNSAKASEDISASYITTSDYEKQLAGARLSAKNMQKITQRVTANSANLEDDYKCLIDRIRNLKDYKAVRVLLEELEASFSTPVDVCRNGNTVGPSNMSKSYTFLAAQMVPALELEAIVTRIRPYAEKASLPDAFLVTGLRRAIALSMVWESGAGKETSYFKAIRDYFIEPNTVSAKKDLIATDIELENLLTNVARRLNTAYIRLSNQVLKLNATNETDTNYFVMDTQVLLGGDKEKEYEDRYVAFGNGEVYAAMANLNFMLYGMHLVKAHKITGLMAALDKVGKQMGLKASLPMGVTAVQQRDILNQDAELFVLKTATTAPCTAPDLNGNTEAGGVPTGICYLRSAYNNLRNGLTNAKLSFVAITTGSDRQKNPAFLIDPNLLLPNTRGFRITEKSIDNSKMIVSQCLGAGKTQPVTVPSLVHNDVTINVCDFFFGTTNAVPGMFNYKGRYYVKDLRGFLPTAPKKSELAEKPKANGFRVRDWESNQGTSWNYPLFNNYIIGVNSAETLREKTRALGAAWGGNLVALPLLTVF